MSYNTNYTPQDFFSFKNTIEYLFKNTKNIQSSEKINDYGLINFLLNRIMNDMSDDYAYNLIFYYSSNIEVQLLLDIIHHFNYVLKGLYHITLDDYFITPDDFNGYYIRIQKI